MYITKRCSICTQEFVGSNFSKTSLCKECLADERDQQILDDDWDEYYQNRAEHVAFRKNECDDCTDPALYADQEERQASEDAEGELLDREAFHQEQLEQEDNDESSGSTDLGNPGGTTFCW